MPLATSRVVFQGETPYAHEREAIEFAIGALPNNDPYHLWALLELLDVSAGRLYELDLVIIGYAAIYLVEVKSGPGRYEGDYMDWYRIDPEDPRRRYMENPFRLTNHKAKVLKSRLQYKMKEPRRCPRVEALTFLSHPDIELRFQPHGDLAVVTRDTFVQAIQHHKFPGAPTHWQSRRIQRPVIKDIIGAMQAIGFRPRTNKAHVGSYQLEELLEDGAGYQDRLAVHREQVQFTKRARTYLVPQQTSVERRQQLRRAADREAQLLWDVREHENVLSITDYITDAELGPTVLFDPFDDAVPLDVFLRGNPNLPYLDRVDIVVQVGRALAHCHHRNIVHGSLSPAAVLVRFKSDASTDDSSTAVEIRLFNFQLGLGDQVEGTVHWSALAQEPWSAYQAPELREDPTNRGVLSDVFSLGALAYFVFTGRPPGQDFVEIDRRLVADRCLDPCVDDDEIQESLAELIRIATDVTALMRADSVDDWVELLITEVTSPEPDLIDEEIDPLQARQGDTLGSDLIVERTLGHGATSRVLEVLRESDNRICALKISLDPEHDQRMSEEADLLDSFRHSRVVQLLDRRTIANRSCLLLTLAGRETLHRHLAREGSVSLEYAGRYGEDLLFALDYLEDQQVLHRDIKPANLGVGATGKEANHLTLFDFSLARARPSELGVGTSAYREPFLSLRGAWDHAAERWSAAVTLHEMLTGLRPTYGKDGSNTTALDPGAELVLAPERFDAAVRDSLVAFFERALAREVEQRYATATEMRHAWLAALQAPDILGRVQPSTTVDTGTDTTATDSIGETKPATDAIKQDEHSTAHAAPSATTDHDAEAVLDDATVAAIAPETPIEALPLSPRAKNALDRAGFSVAEDLLTLADNRLSAIRGIGTQIAREILDFRKRWSALRTLAPTASRPFYPGYRGDDLLVATAALSDVTTAALADAGLRTFTAVAMAPASQLDALAQRQQADIKALRALLDQENAKANERAHPSTLEGWVEALLPAKKRGMRFARMLFGLTNSSKADANGSSFRNRLDVRVREVAQIEEVTPPAIYIALGKCRKQWAEHRALDELRRAAEAILDAAGGALHLKDAADQLRAGLPHNRSSEPEFLRTQAAALLRVLAEVSQDPQSSAAAAANLATTARTVHKGEGQGEPASLYYARLHAEDSEPWLLSSNDLLPILRRLGDAADELADRPVLASPGEVARQLADVLDSDTPGLDSYFAKLSPERLSELAAAASQRAARSSRLEIYPRDLAPERALSLSSALLRSGLSPEDIQQRVARRYPAGQAIPQRPALDELLEAHGLSWDEIKGTYHRAGESDLTTLRTRVSSLGRFATALPSQARSMDPEAIAAREFHDKLKNAVERRSLRVLGVTMDRAEEATASLSKFLNTPPISFDKLFLAATEVQAKKGGIKREGVIYEADFAGSGSKLWRPFMRLVKAATEQVTQELLTPPPAEPLLLVQPGLIARYRLVSFLEALLATSKLPEAAAIFVLVPAHDTGGTPLINGQLAFPGLLSSQALWVRREWLENRGNAAEAAEAATNTQQPTSSIP